MYGLDDHQKLLCVYTELSHWILIWPQPSEMHREGKKHQYIRQLDRIARIDDSPRPLTRLLSDKGQIPTGGGVWVIKREFSAFGCHVRVVDLDGLRKDSKEYQDAFQEVWSSSFDWIIQSYVPLLEQWGEWRVFMIGGKATYTVMTTKQPGGGSDDWDWNKVESLFTLEELTFVHSIIWFMFPLFIIFISRARWNKDPNISADKVGFPKGLSQVALEVAKKELHSFAEHTLSHLIKAERRAYHFTPSIALFCRMDIGIMPNKNGDLRYFVNEITRSPVKTCLWSGSAPDTEAIAHNLGADFSIIFYEYLCTEHPDLCT